MPAASLTPVAGEESSCGMLPGPTSVLKRA